MSCKYVVSNIIENQQDAKDQSIGIIRHQKSNNLRHLLREAFRQSLLGQYTPNITAQIVSHLGQSSDSAHMTNGQQSASEFFCFLVDKLDLGWLFHHRHELRIVCQSCGHTNISTDVSGQFEISDVTVDNYNTIISDKYYKDTYIADGYKCDKCKSVDVVHHRNLKLTPEYIVVIFTEKYYKKYDVGYPNILDIKTKTRIFSYKAIAHVDHYGSLSGGHYTATAIRGDKTYLFNDQSYTEATLSSTSNTYIVFYEQQ